MGNDARDNLSIFLSGMEQVATPQRGDLLSGVILSISSNGLVIDLGLKRDGIVPRSDLERIPSSEGNFKAGDRIAVMIVDLADQDDNLVVSIAQARESEDWLKAQSLLENGSIFEGIPQSYNRGGLIIPFGRLRGFVPASHISEMPRGLEEADRIVKLQCFVDRKMPLKVIEVDPKRRRLVLSERKAVRQWRQEQKAHLLKTLKVDEVHDGIVTSLCEFGVFVDIGGADGLIHISELAWRRVEDPSKILTVGQEIKVLIYRLDEKANRIGLSFKRLQPNPWEAAADQVVAGQLISGSVSHLGKAGAYVWCDEIGLEGLIRFDNIPEQFQVGLPIKALVKVFNIERERLELDLTELKETVDHSTVE